MHAARNMKNRERFIRFLARGFFKSSLNR